MPDGSVILGHLGGRRRGMGLPLPVDGTEQGPVVLPLDPSGQLPGSVLATWLGVWLCDIAHLCLMALGQTR